MGEGEQEHQVNHTLHEPASSSPEDLFNQISTGAVTDPHVLNVYLDFQMQSWRNYAKEQTDGDPDLFAVEHSNEQTLRFIKARNGSYQKEKAEFCLQEAQGWLAGVKVGERLGRQNNIAECRSYAANWLRMAAACLEMPEESKLESP